MDALRAYLRTLTGFERDARRFLLVTLAVGAAGSLYWIDFNLYLASLDLPTSVIGIIATGTSVAGALVAFPASALSDRVGRRLVIAGGVALMAVAHTSSSRAGRTSEASCSRSSSRLST